MASGSKLEKPEPVVSGMKSEPISEQVEHVVASAKGVTSYSTSSISKSGDARAKSKPKSEVNGTSGFKGVSDQASAGENSIYSPTSSSYSYYYPGYNGSFTQVDDNGYYQVDGSHMGVHSDNGSVLYYLPGGYTPYMDGSLVGADVQSQQPYYSSGYIQHPVPYGSEAVPCYSWDSTYVGDVSNGNTGSKNGKYSSGSSFAKSNGFSSVKFNGNNSNNGFKSSNSTQSVRPLNKVPTYSSNFSGSLLKSYNNVGNYSYPVRKQGSVSHNGPMNYRQNGRIWNGNDRNKPSDSFHKNTDLEPSPELTCGPRRASSKNTRLESPVKEDLGITIKRAQYNQPDFETVYTNAKFYIIKSYNEDDIHKSIKYDVWSSTPNGNKKLDAAFRDAEQKSMETGTRCPVFLFFSVNGSGQFVGIAEMVGQVDFDKDMDFWQIDKWNGFFPVKWHVVKDIPNNHLRHIILENNERRPVTFSRDTQEIPLKQGLEMLNIFKSYAVKSSLVDDFDFYESREKTSLSKKNKLATLRMDELTSGEFAKNDKDEGAYKDENDPRTDTIINLTKNMSLNGPNQKSNSVKKGIENSIAAP